MIASHSSKILVGISLDPDESKDVLSWAINVLAQPRDTVIAFHVLVGEEPRKRPLKKKKQTQIRHAKAHVISVLGEFTKTCYSKQLNLEAKVGFSHSVGRGVVEEVKTIAADYLVLRRSRNHQYTVSHQVARCALELLPSGCSVVFVGKQMKPDGNSDSDSAITKGIKKRSSMRSNDSKSSCSTEISTVENEENRQNSSPRTVLDAVEGDYNSSVDAVEGDYNSSVDDALSVADSTVSISPDKPNPRSVVTGKSFSPYRLFSSIFSSPHRMRKDNTPVIDKPQPLIQCFSYEEITGATNNFHQDSMVGVGGYSEVYGGALFDGRSIAVKRLSKDNNDMNKEKEFLTELGITSHVFHPNTANLLGFCIENGLYLVFKLSENGNLYSALHGEENETLEWGSRYKIAMGVARGLHYLHKCCKHRIIHRDIKASNVLLGPDYEPQIADFGLAKWLPYKCTHQAVIPIEGTFGYLAPEYFMQGIVDEKIDVYSFGILLLEIITGRRPVDSSQQSLLLWAKPMMEAGNIAELSDPRLKGKYDEDEMRRLLLTSCYCVRQSPAWRPSMTEVLQLLVNGEDNEVARNWRMPEFTSDELDDYSMVSGYEIAIESCLEDSF